MLDFFAGFSSARKSGISLQGCTSKKGSFHLLHLWSLISYFIFRTRQMQREMLSPFLLDLSSSSSFQSRSMRIWQRYLFYLYQAVWLCMLFKGEYATILNDYQRAKALFKGTEVALFKEGISLWVAQSQLSFLIVVMEAVDDKMLRLRDQLRRRLIDCPTSFEEQSKLIKYLKVIFHLVWV